MQAFYSAKEPADVLFVQSLQPCIEPRENIGNKPGENMVTNVVKEPGKIPDLKPGIPLTGNLGFRHREPGIAAQETLHFWHRPAGRRQEWMGKSGTQGEPRKKPWK